MLLFKVDCELNARRIFATADQISCDNNFRIHQLRYYNLIRHSLFIISLSFVERINLLKLTTSLLLLYQL